MAKAKFTIKVQCTDCGCIISQCAQCEKPFKDNQAINCVKDGLLHVCKKCE